MLEKVSATKPNNLCRKGYIDIAKGIGLYLVVLGHLVHFNGIAFKWIFSFHMMLFFFISGYVFDSNKYSKFKFSKYLDRKVKSILLPFAIVSVIGWIASFIIPNWRYKGENAALSLVYFAQPENLHVGQIWFLACLFWVEIFFFIIIKLFNKINISATIFITILISVIGFSMNQVTFLNYHRIPWKLDSAITALVFYTFGFYSKKLGLLDSLFRKKFVSFLLMIISGILGFYISVYRNGYVNICDCQFSDYYYFYLAAFCGIIFILIISKFCEKSLCFNIMEETHCGCFHSTHFSYTYLYTF